MRRGTAVDPADVDAIAAVVRRCAAVAGLHGGGPVQIATYLPGRRVDGVRVGDDAIELSLVSVHGVPVIALADQVRAAVAPFASGRRIDVHVADVQLPGEGPPALPAGPDRPPGRS